MVFDGRVRSPRVIRHAAAKLLACPVETLPQACPPGTGINTNSQHDQQSQAERLRIFTMPRYRNHGIGFSYPDEWEIIEESGDECTTITVAEPEGTSFWSLHLMWKRPQVEEVLDQIDTAFREEYDEIDIEPSVVRLARRESEARQIDFVCLELVNTALVRVFRTGRFTVMLLCQATDHELDEMKVQFQEISDTLDVDLDGDILIS